MGGLYHAGGFLIVWVGILGLGFFGLCLGSALGKVTAARINGRPEDVKVGGGIYVGITKPIISGLIQAGITFGVPAAFLWAFHYIARTNFGAFLSFR